MPGNEPEADDLEALANQETETAADPQGTQSDPVLDALKPSGHAEGQQQRQAPQQQTQDWQKRYQAMRPEFDKARTKANTLDAIVNNPRLRELAQTDPTVAQALAKAGYKLAAEQAQADGDEGAQADDQYWTSPEGRMDVMEAAASLRYEMEDFAMQSLGRRFNADEVKQVKAVIAKAGTLTVEEAWTLTPAAKAQRLANEQKRLAEAQARGSKGPRPRPTPNALGGGAEKLDMKKHPSQFNDAEKQEFLRNLPQ